MSRAADLVASLPWAMTEIYLRAILEIAGREPGPALEHLRAENRTRLDGLQGKAGTPLRGTASVTLRGDTAIVPVSGPIFPYANLFTAMSGATSLEQLAADFTMAIDSPQVSRVLLAIDSPGGQTNGIAEFATLVRDAQAKKPVLAYVADQAQSAAYWIAAAAGKIYVAPTAQLGSIGVVGSVKPKDPNDKTVEIVSSQSPDKRPDVTTDAGRAQVQALVDRLAQEFVASVAANRGVTEAKVLADFGQGASLVGADAVAAGMADQVTTLERLLTGPAAAGRTGSVPTVTAAAVVPQERPSMSATAPTPAAAPVVTTITTIDALRAAYPDLVTAIEAQSATTAATAERTRVLGIQAHGASIKGHDKLVADAIADGKSTPDQVAGRLVAAEGAKGTAVLAALETDGTKGPTPAPSAAAPPANPPKSAATNPEAWAAEYKASAALQAEFPTEQDYVALRKAEAKGGVRVLGATAK